MPEPTHPVPAGPSPAPGDAHRITPLDVRWLTVFADLAPAAEQDVPFWVAVTGWPLSPWRGAHEEFATLVPPDGRDTLRVQRCTAGPGGVHLDLHLPVASLAELDAPAAAAQAWGAVRVARVPDDDGPLGYVTLASPGGLPFCLVPDRRAGEPAPAPTPWPGGHRSLFRQVCLDAPPALFDAEVAFWAGLTGWPVEPFPGLAVVALGRPAHLPLRVIVQRTDDPAPAVGGHPEWWADDLDAEVTRHLGLGATLGFRGGHWQVLHAPSGADYCVIARDPRL